MNNRIALWCAVSALSVAGMAQTASAQDCPCDCYFSSDCSQGFCDWGNLSNEDSCWWRLPKPQGVPGAGCQDDYGDWGQCDGICNDSLGPNGFTHEDVTSLSDGVTLWADAFHATARNGGGLASDAVLLGFDSVEYRSPNMADDIGKIVVELLMLTHGRESIVFPRQVGFLTTGVQIAAIDHGSCSDVNGELAVDALLEEISVSGAGQNLVAEMDQACLDTALLDRVCGESIDSSDCLYKQIANFGDILGRTGRTDLRFAAGDGTCWPSSGDVDGNGVVDFEDLLALLGAWGDCPNPTDGDPMACPADFDDDELVTFSDLLVVLGGWS